MLDSCRESTCETAQNSEQAQFGVCDKILSLDLGPIMFKLASKTDGAGWPIEKVLRVVNEYRKFLILCGERPAEPIVPSEEVDEMWHAHILDTGKYAADCQAVFGYFLHHFPYLGVRGGEDANVLAAAFARTKELHSDRFDIRVENSEAADCMTGCGSVACSPSSCTNNLSNDGVDLITRPSLKFAD